LIARIHFTTDWILFFEDGVPVERVRYVLARGKPGVSGVELDLAVFDPDRQCELEIRGIAAGQWGHYRTVCFLLLSPRRARRLIASGQLGLSG
jgi:hypothetical protein